MDYSDWRRSKNVEDNRNPTGEHNPFGETVSGKLGDVWRQATSNQSLTQMLGSAARGAGIPNSLGTGPDSAPKGSLEEQAGNNSDYWNDPAKADNASTESDGSSQRDRVSGNVNAGAINTTDAPADTGSNALDAVQAAMDYGQQKLMGGNKPQANTGSDQSQSFEGGGPVLPITPPLPNLADEHAIDMNRLSTSAAKRAQAAVTKRSSGTQSYAEGGAVEDDQAEPQAAPQAQDDAGGTPDPNLPVGNQGDATPLARPPAPANWPQDRAGILPTTSSGDIQGQVKQATSGDQPQQPPQQQPQIDPAAIHRHLSGEGAVSKQTYDAYANRADPTSTMMPDARNIATVQKAMEDAGPKAAHGIIQYDRKAWDHEMNLGRLALTQGKPEDVVKHLNEAYHYMPDGTHIDWSQNESGGYRADVEFNTANRKPVPGIDPAGKKQSYQNIELTPEQLHDWVNIGKAGQFDTVYAKSGPNVLQELAKSQGTPLPQGQPSGQQSQQDQAQQRQGSPQGQPPGQPPGQFYRAGQVANPPGWQTKGQQQGELQFDRRGQVTDPRAAQAQGWVQDPDGIWQPPGRHIQSDLRGVPRPNGSRYQGTVIYGEQNNTAPLYTSKRGPPGSNRRDLLYPQGHEVPPNPGMGDQPEQTPQQYLQSQKWQQTSRDSDQTRAVAPGSREERDQRLNAQFPSVNQRGARAATETALDQKAQENEVAMIKAKNPLGVQTLKNAGGADVANIKGGYFIQKANVVEAGKTARGAQVLEAMLAKTQSAADSKAETDQTNLLREYVKAAPFMPGGIPEGVAAAISARFAKQGQGQLGNAPVAAPTAPSPPPTGRNATTGSPNLGQFRPGQTVYDKQGKPHIVQ